MDKFIVEPADCLILKALRDSASLREAAVLLGCDPAGLARNVQHISKKMALYKRLIIVGKSNGTRPRSFGLG